MKHAWALMAAVALMTGIARADETAGADEVTLKNGGSIRGTVVASEPGSSVKIIEMGSTDVRVVPWAEVAGVEKGKYAAKAETSAPPAPPAPAAREKNAPSLETPGVVRVHIEHPTPVRLYELRTPVHGSGYGAGGAVSVVITSADLLCTSPCDALVDGRKGQAFTVMGDFPTGNAFQLLDKKGDVELTILPGDESLRGLGVAGVITGGVALLAGGSLVLAGPILGESDRDKADTLLTAGVVTAITGAVVLAGGIVALVSMTDTQVDVHERRPARSAEAFGHYIGGL